MNIEKISKRMQERGIRPTAVRLLVARTLADAGRLLSLADLENMLVTVPKSTIFRALVLFADKHLVHCAEDGSGILRYELCYNDYGCDIRDMHPHFYCEVCKQTYCFKDVNIPVVPLPDGYRMHSVNYMIKGVCEKCAGR